MAVTAKFQADFQSFHTAVQAAEIKLRSFETGAGKVGTALDRMANSLSGQKVISEAALMERAIENMGGTSKLTSAELQRVGVTANEAMEKMKKLGMDVPPGLQKIASETKGVTGNLGSMLGSVSKIAGAFGIAFSVGAVVSFGKSILSAADALTKLHDKTGISLQGLQKFQIAGDDAGNTIEQLSTAVTQMQNRLAGGDASAVGALTKLHLSLADLKGLAPDQQFIKISDAIRQVKDPADQVNIAMDLFGRQGAEVLPTIKRGFDDLKDGAVGMSDAAVKALDVTGDAIARLWRGTKAAIGEATGQAILAITNSAAVTSAGTLAEWYRTLTGSAADLAAAVAKVPPPLQHYAEAAKAATLTTTAQANIERQLGVALRDTEEARKLATTATKKAAEEAQTFAQDLTDAYDRERAMGRQALMTSESMRTLKESALASGGIIADSFQRAQQRMESFTRVVNDLPKFDLNDFFKMGTVEAPHLDDLITKTSTLTTALGKIPDLLTAAFVGGGGVLGAIKAIGVEISRSILEPLKDKLSTASKAAVGFGAAMATGLGSASGLNATTTSILGIGTGLAGAALAASAWGTGMAAAGVAGTVALGAATLGIGAAAIGVAMLIKKFTGLTKEVKEARKGLQEFEQSLWSTMTAQQEVESQGQTWKATIITVRDAYVATGRSAASALDAVSALWDTDNPARMAAAMREINDVFQLQTRAQEALTGALGRYKFSVEELGPAMANQKLNEQAKQLYQDWQVLVGAGVDVAAVGREMQGSINDFVQTSMKMKTDIEPAMRPMLEQMAKMGLLTDAAGEKITDLKGSGITFAMTMSEGFQAIVDEVKNLTKVIRISLGLAIDETAEKIRAFPNLDVGVNMGVNMPEAPRPFYQEAPEVQHFAGGGKVLPWRPRGTDTVPAMLTPGERVLSRRETAAYDTGQSGGVTIIFEQDGRAQAEYLVPYVVGAIQRVAGLRK